MLGTRAFHIHTAKYREIFTKSYKQDSELCTLRIYSRRPSVFLAIFLELSCMYSKAHERYFAKYNWDCEYNHQLVVSVSKHVNFRINIDDKERITSISERTKKAVKKVNFIFMLTHKLLLLFIFIFRLCLTKHFISSLAYFLKFTQFYCFSAHMNIKWIGHENDKEILFYFVSVF